MPQTTVIIALNHNLSFGNTCSADKSYANNYQIQARASKSNCNFL